MDGEEGGGLRLSKRFTDKDGGEVDYKTKAGTAWSHSFLNQKPWHPLSYPNQRRKWIAEQTHAQRERHAEEVSREFAQEQEFFRQTSLVSQKEKEKMEMMRAVSFMYVRPPGYNAESATAAELAKDKPNQEQEEVGSSMPGRTEAEDKKKPRPKDVFGRALPTEEQFEVLKNAPRLETGVAARSKPFGIEIRNVKCLRCGNFGHQSGDRECPMKDAVMPSEQSRLKRDDPLTAIMAQTDLNEPLKWELKHTPGLSPPRGGFKADDPNQQIVAEDIFDEYGGFLEGDGIPLPALLTNFYSSSPKKKSSQKKHRKKSLPSSTKVHDPEKGSYSSDDYKDGDRNLKNKRGKYSARKNLSSSSSEESDFSKPKIRASERYDANNNKSSSAARDRGSRSKQKQHDRRPSRMSESSLKEPRECGQSSSKEKERVYSDKKRQKRKSRKKFSESSQSDHSERERKSSKRERHRRKSRKASYSTQSNDSESDYDRHPKRSVKYKHSHRPVSVTNR